MKIDLENACAGLVLAAELKAGDRICELENRVKELEAQLSVFGGDLAKAAASRIKALEARERDLMAAYDVLAAMLCPNALPRSKQ